MAAVDAERGQLVAITGLVMAVTFVVLALVLNTAIYTENLAHRSDATDGVDALEFRNEARVGVGGSVDYVDNASAGDPYSTLYDEYETTVDDWVNLTGRHLVVTGRTARVIVPASPSDGGMEGTLIADDDASTQLLPVTSPANPLGYSTPNWLVANESQVRQFGITVTADSLTETTAGDPASTGAFFVEVRDGSDTWRVGLYNDSGDSVDDVTVVVYDVDDGSTVGTCGEEAVEVTVDLTGAAVADDECAALSFVDGLSGDADIYYGHADQAVGTYQLFVDRVGHAAGDPLKDAVDAANYGNHCSGPTYNDGAATSPYATAAIYSATVDLRYESAAVSYATDVRVAPDEPEAGSVAPVVEEFTVTDSNANDGAFTVTWAVTDPNDDPMIVSLTLVDPAGAETTYAVSNSGSQSVSGTPLSGTYQVKLSAVDGTNTRAVTEHHEDDGDDSGCPP